ncbi:MAG: hypothetical protein FJZ62_05910, partial [Chlamydiae bacterium]|nr:hypothetical protein [Chlamydiota bacterium]
MIDIYSLTQKQYADAIFKELDKGKELAKLVYSLWFKEGRHPLENEILPTAKKLLQKILEITDFSIPSTFEQKGSKWLQTFSD